ncbi:MAG: cytochrome C oxidase subunit IV family protein [Pseudomonas sp.]
MKRYALEIGLVGLLGLTLGAWLIGHNVSASWVVGCVLAITFVKGQWLIDEFMELRHAPQWLRLVISGWLVLVVGMTALFNI